MRPSPITTPLFRDSIASAWKIGSHAARVNLVPGLVLQGFAVLLLLAYLHAAAFRHALEAVSRLQDAHGLAFSFATRAVFSGFVPFLFQACMPSLRPARLFRTLAFTTLWWGFQGAVSYGFYVCQAHLYGAGNSISVVTAKVLTDMLVFTPVWGCPSNAVSHLWLDRSFSWRQTRAELGKGWYARIVLPNLLPAWALWCPGVAVVYSLPTLLQPHMAALIGCFWALLCLKIAHDSLPSSSALQPHRHERKIASQG
jgi:hypothetical protein